MFETFPPEAVPTVAGKGEPVAEGEANVFPKYNTNEFAPNV
jgi:hypothetical protein